MLMQAHTCTPQHATVAVPLFQLEMSLEEERLLEEEYPSGPSGRFQALTECGKEAPGDLWGPYLQSSWVASWEQPLSVLSQQCYLKKNPPT